MKNQNRDKQELAPLEALKERSNYLRGTITESLNDSLTGTVREDDLVVIKFHGSYVQQDRDLDDERKRQKLEPLYSFLIRVRVPGGISTPEQWIAMDELADVYGDKTLKLTTRQAFQLHGVLKRNLKTTIKKINDTLLDTIAACGDVNRNVMSSSNPFESPIHLEVAEHASMVNTHLTPATHAYHEIWLDEKLVAGGEPEEVQEPLYGKYYLPRKFKTAFAIPPRNDVDVLANDLGFIAVVENNQLIGYNLSVGGGMGSTFGNTSTYPRVADVVGFLHKKDVVKIAEGVLIFQRDFGNRVERKNARFKYTMDKYGVDFFKTELTKITGIELEPVKPFKFDTLGDKYGWNKGADGQWHYTVFVEGGKLIDKNNYNQKTALKEIAKIHKGIFILTGNQNVVIANVSEKEKQNIETILQQFGVIDGLSISQIRQNSIACASLPLCGLAFAEAERYLPKLVDKIDAILEKNNLLQVPIVIRMTGCPNGCGRPFLAEIGMVGKAPGRYNLYLGASFTGERLNKLYREMLDEEGILKALTPLLEDFAKSRNADEHFGDFVIRKGYIKPTLEGKKFHEDLNIKTVDFQI